MLFFCYFCSFSSFFFSRHSLHRRQWCSWFSRCQRSDFSRHFSMWFCRYLLERSSIFSWLLPPTPSRLALLALRLRSTGSTIRHVATESPCRAKASAIFDSQLSIFLFYRVFILFNHHGFHMVAQHICNRENGTFKTVVTRHRHKRTRVRYVKSVLAFHDSDATDQ